MTALRERLRRRMHLVRVRASAMNRIFGLLRQWGAAAVVAPAARSRSHGTSPTTRHALAALDPETLAVIELLDARIAPFDHELGPLAHGDARRVAGHDPGHRGLLGLALASEIVASGGEVAVGAEARVLVLGPVRRLARRHGEGRPGAGAVEISSPWVGSREASPRRDGAGHPHRRASGRRGRHLGAADG